MTDKPLTETLSVIADWCDLNGDYLAQAMERNRDIPMGLDVA